MVHDDAPVPQYEHTIGQVNRLVDVVGDEQHRRAMPSEQIADEILHLQPCERIESCKGFVEQQQLWLAHQPPRQGDALRFASRQGGGPRPLMAREADLGERLACDLLA